MAKTKTTYTGQNVIDFVNSYVENEQKKADSFRLINLSALKEICIESIKYISEHHECSCRVK